MRYPDSGGLTAAERARLIPARDEPARVHGRGDGCSLRSRRAGGGDQMTAPGAPGADAAWWRLAGIGLLGIGVAAAVYLAGRLHRPDYAFSMFGADPIPPKSLLATIVLGLAVLQVLLALWMYRK